MSGLSWLERRSSRPPADADDVVPSPAPTGIPAGSQTHRLLQAAYFVETLIHQVRANEDDILARVFESAQRHGYTRYSSTLIEAWRLSVRGLTDALVAALECGTRLDFGIDDEQGGDPLTHFGREAALRHRSRGVTLSMFLGLSKYYRDAFAESCATSLAGSEEQARCRFVIGRLFDRIERGHVRHVVAGEVHQEKFAQVPGAYTRIGVGAPLAGWTAFADSRQGSEAFTPDGPTQASDPLLLYFTSGTTSKPKLVLHTHQSYPVGHLSTMFWIGLKPGDIHMNISSPGWAKHAWSCFFAPWNAGACIFIHNTARFAAPALLETLARCDVDTLCAPPTVWRMLIQEDLASWRGKLSLREVIGAGEPLNPEIIEQIKSSWGLTLRDGYGQTETTAIVGNAPGLAVKPGSMGLPMPGYRVALLDVNGEESDEGEVCLRLDDPPGDAPGGHPGTGRPLGLMAGYEDSAERTAEVMHGGYYRTGDVAQRDADGYYTFVGRADDVFKASDYRISPFELESALIEHASVVEVAVVPSPDPVRLAVPKAFIILAQGSRADAQTAREILAFARQALAPYKRVRRIEFVTELPKTISGKIRRVELRQTESGRRERGAKDPLEFFEDDFPDLKT